MRCKLCWSKLERISYVEDPLPGIPADLIRVTVLVCPVCGVVDREDEMISPVTA